MILAGRERERALLREKLAAASQGRGSLVFLYGEAGMGKSALSAALCQDAEEAGFRVERGRALELALAPPWFPLRSCLRALSIDPRQIPSSDAEVFGLWESVLEALTRESARTPVLWQLEDLHAADAQTLELLAYLAHPARALRFIVLASVRSNDPRVQPLVMERLTRLARDGVRIELPPLGASDVGAIVQEIVGQPLDASAIAGWTERTGGNPLFVVECARTMQTGRGVQATLPSTVVQVVLERLHALPKDTQTLLELGAVLGRELSAADVGRMSDQLPAVVIDGLFPALRSGLLEELSPGNFRFSHALVCEAILGALPTQRRRQAHAKAEAALAALGDTADRLVARAWHAIDAIGVISEERALAIVTSAIALLQKQGAHDRAYAVWFRWSEIGARAPTPEALIEGARLATLAGNYSGARAHAQGALALARERNDPRAFALAALTLGADLRPGAVVLELVRALEEAAAWLGSSDAPLACRVQARLAAALQPAPQDPQVPVAMARRAIAEARRIGDPDVLRDVLYSAYSAMSDYTDVSETQPLAEELLASAIAAKDQERALRAYCRRAVGHLELGDFAAFEIDCDNLIAEARSTNHPRLTWRPLLIASMRALACGRFSESDRFLEEVDELARLTDDPALLNALNAHRAMRFAAMDDESNSRMALQALEQSIEGSPENETIRPMIRALFAIRFHWIDVARSELRFLFRPRLDMPAGSGYLSISGEAAAIAGTPEICARAHALLLPFEGRDSHTGHIPYSYEGPDARVIALLEARLGKTDVALERLGRVSDRLRAHAQRSWLARTLVDRAQVLVDAGRSADAVAEEAIALSDSLGMRNLKARAEALVHRRGARATPTAPPPGTARAQSAALAPRGALLLLREGDTWRVALGSREAHVKDSRGMEMLARLVAQPSERIHALVLVGGEDGAPDSDAGEMLDDAALRAYRARLDAIDEDIEEAELRADQRRRAKLEAEKQAITEELSRAVGLGGRVRRAGSATERARVNATRRIKDALARIKEVEPTIGEHLEDSVRTGTYSCYRPTEPGR